MDRTTFSTDGTGNQGGDIVTWSVSENVTPVAPGAPAAAAGGTTVTVDADDESDLLVGDEYTLTDAEYGTVSGRVTNANLGPLGVSITGDNPISRLSATRTVPPGGVDLGALIQDSAYTGPAGWIHARPEVNPINNRIYTVSWNVSRISVFEADGTYLFSWGSSGTGNGQFGALSHQGLRLAIDPATGNVFVPDMENNRIQIFSPAGVFQYAISVGGPVSLAYKNGLLYVGCVRNSTGTSSQARVIRMTLTGGSQVNLAASVAQFASNEISYMALTDNYILALANNLWTRLSYSGTAEPVRYYNYGVDPNGSWLRSIEGYGTSILVAWYSRYLDENNVIRIRDWKVGLVPETHEQWGTDLNSTLTILSGSGSSSLMNTAFSMLEDGSLPVLVGFGLGYQRYSFVAPTPPLSELMQRYIDSLNAEITLDYRATVDPYIAAPGWTDSVWTKLNELCVAYNVEIAMVDEVLTVRDVGSASLNVEDMTPVSKQVSLDGASRYVDIPYTNARAGVGTVYDAARDGSGRTFEVAVRETKTEILTTTNYPVALQQPQRVNTFRPAPGQYYLIGSDGLPVAAGQFEDYGGSVSVSIGKDPGTLEVRLAGPIRPIPGVDGPFRLAISDGDNVYPTFSVIGTGVFTSPNTLNLSTGADWDLVTNETSSTAAANIFIGSYAQAFDRGLWTAADAAGPNLNLTFSISYGDSNGFGLTTGSMFEAYNSIWRVTSVNFGVASVSVNAVPHTTIGDVDPLWVGETIGDFEAAWSGYKMKDFRVRPLDRRVD